MKKSFIKRNTKNAGFTLVETLVAIAILMIAIAGPLTVAEKGLSAAIYARDKLIGSYLAQDGMEAIKNIVDTNEIYIGSTANSDVSDHWITYGGVDLANVSAGCNYNPITKIGNICTIDTVSNPNSFIINHCLSASDPSSCSPLNLSPSGYVQGGTSPTTPFTRYFYVQPFTVSGGGNGGADNAANIVMTVTWPGDVVGGGGVILEDTMFDTPLQ
jgi:prepilin-type N-terminal cleavage/methylation domain-containing protein